MFPVALVSKALPLLTRWKWVLSIGVLTTACFFSARLGYNYATYKCEAAMRSAETALRSKEGDIRDVATAYTSQTRTLEARNGELRERIRKLLEEQAAAGVPSRDCLTAAELQLVNEAHLPPVPAESP